MRRFALIRTVNASSGLRHVALPKKLRSDNSFLLGNVTGIWRRRLRD
jgi:hypothetical protein